jgi:K+-transporting ATPase ATPase C chain
MRRDLYRSLVAMVVLTAVCGFAYPAVVWAVGQIAFDAQANGTLVTRNGTVVGSSLLGQSFTSARYFHGRPSVTGYAANGSAGSNLGPNSAQLAKDVRARLLAVARENGVPTSRVPVDLVTASASGVDPDISVAGAMIQVPRVAAARGLPQARVAQLVHDHTVDPTLGFLGTRRVNVLDLNLALDRLR